MTRTPFRTEELEDLFAALARHFAENPKAIIAPVTRVEIWRLAATIDKLLGIKNGA